jgi:hypothetical protein
LEAKKLEFTIMKTTTIYPRAGTKKKCESLSAFPNKGVQFLTFLRLNLTLKYIRESDDNHAEGSRPAAHNISDVDDPFTNVISKNAMPTPPNKEKKVYLEDYENFVVK